MGIFDKIKDELNSSWKSIRSESSARRECENKLWNIVSTIDLSDKRIEYDIWNIFYGAKEYRIFSPSGDYIQIQCPEPRLARYGYNITYYKKKSYNEPYEHVFYISVSSALDSIGDISTIQKLVHELERRKHSSHVNDMDAF